MTRLIVLIVGFCATAPLLRAAPFPQEYQPVPLRFDRDLRVWAGVRGAFQSPLDTEPAFYGHFGVHVAAFAPNEHASIAIFESHRVQRYRPPQIAGWGYFRCADPDTLRLVVDVRDARQRLQKAVVRSFEDAEILGRALADRAGARIFGAVPVSLRDQYFVIEVYGRSGKMLCHLLIDRARWDQEIPIAIEAGFQPVPLRMNRCPHVKQSLLDIHMPVGAPNEVFRGTPTLRPATVQSEVIVPYEHRSPAGELQRSQVPDLQGYEVYHWLGRHVIDPNADPLPRWLWYDYSSKVREKYERFRRVMQEDIPDAVPRSFTVPPWAKGCLRWRIRHTGYVFVVLLLPYERVKSIPEAQQAILQAIPRYFKPRRGSASSVFASAANTALQADARLRRMTGVLPGEVMPGLSLYAIEGVSVSCEAIHTEPISEERTPGVAGQ
ncbi:MAG: hypothetical protein ACP5RN_05465 [Armatimonadota bacterium]